MPNMCQCSLNYYGPLCEFEKIPCSDLPKTPLFTFRKCESEYVCNVHYRSVKNYCLKLCKIDMHPL